MRASLHPKRRSASTGMFFPAGPDSARKNDASSRGGGVKAARLWMEERFFFGSESLYSSSSLAASARWRFARGGETGDFAGEGGASTGDRVRRLASWEAGKRGNYHDERVVEAEARDFALSPVASHAADGPAASSVSTVSTVGGGRPSARRGRRQIGVEEELGGGELPVLAVVLVFALLGVPFQGLEKLLPPVFVLGVRGEREDPTMIDLRSKGIVPALMATTVAL